MLSRTSRSNQTLEKGLLRKAETAWLNQDLAASTTTLAEKNGCTNPFVKEAPLNPVTLPRGIRCEPLFYRGESLDSHLVTFERGVAVFDIGVPLLSDGTFFSHAFTHLKYPERYVHLFDTDAGHALQTAAQNDHHVADAYITLVRPPYYHWLMDTLAHLYGATRLKHLHQVKLVAPETSPLTSWQRGLLERTSKVFGISNLAYLPMNGTAVALRPGYSQTRLGLSHRVSLVRQLLPSSGKVKPHRFLFSRRGPGDRRQLENEEAVIAALGEQFTVIEPGAMDFDSQASLFAEARCVIGVHGSNLTNIAFCRPGTAVVEIAAGLPQPHFEAMAKEACLQFRRVNAVPIDGEALDRTWAQAHGNLTVDPAYVAQAVEDALSFTNP